MMTLFSKNYTPIWAYREGTAAILTGATTKVLPGTFGLLQKMKLTAPIAGILIMVVQMYTEIPYIKI